LKLQDNDADVFRIAILGLKFILPFSTSQQYDDIRNNLQKKCLDKRVDVCVDAMRGLQELAHLTIDSQQLNNLADIFLSIFDSKKKVREIRYQVVLGIRRVAAHLSDEERNLLLEKLKSKSEGDINILSRIHFVFASFIQDPKVHADFINDILSQFKNWKRDEVELEKLIKAWLFVEDKERQSQLIDSLESRIDKLEKQGKRQDKRSYLAVIISLSALAPQITENTLRIKVVALLTKALNKQDPKVFKLAIPGIVVLAPSVVGTESFNLIINPLIEALRDKRFPVIEPLPLIEYLRMIAPYITDSHQRMNLIELLITTPNNSYPTVLHSTVNCFQSIAVSLTDKALLTLMEWLIQKYQSETQPNNNLVLAQCLSITSSLIPVAKQPHNLSEVWQKMLNDEDVKVGQLAANHLSLMSVSTGDFNNPKMPNLQFNRAWMERQPIERLAVIAPLIKDVVQQDSTLRFLESQLQTGNDSLRLTIVNCLRRLVPVLGSSEQQGNMFKILKMSANDEAINIRCIAMAALRLMASLLKDTAQLAELTDFFLIKIDFPNQSIRREAINGLGAIAEHVKDEGTLTKLIDRLELEINSGRNSSILAVGYLNRLASIITNPILRMKLVKVFALAMHHEHWEISSVAQDGFLKIAQKLAEEVEQQNEQSQEDLTTLKTTLMSQLEAPSFFARQSAYNVGMSMMINNIELGDIPASNIEMMLLNNFYTTHQQYLSLVKAAEVVPKSNTSNRV
ncbi:MAG: hypothetical protein LCH30_11845, partial [Proteobacteria bacterium]|nr:hypothetical protein [Pseudomonadota bacterium]